MFNIYIYRLNSKKGCMYDKFLDRFFVLQEVFRILYTYANLRLCTRYNRLSDLENDIKST